MIDSNLIKNIMDDIRVELTDEFDKNFERKAFFDRPWAPLSPNYRPKDGSMLVRTGALRESIRPHVNGNTLTYTSSTPYATIHNEGGTIHQEVVPTPKMRRWAWANYRKSKDEKFRRMALAKRIQRTITIPARPFIGKHPMVDAAVDQIVKENVKKVADRQIKQMLNLKKK